MSFEDSQNRLRKHILGIKNLVSNSELVGLVAETGIVGQAMIDAHNTEGRYLGGDYANKGYSTTTLPLFFFGDFTLVERTGNVRLSNPELQIGGLLIRKEDIQWTTSNSGRKVAWLKGGYAKFLKYSRPGKSINKVDHTFSGAMLRNLTHDTTIETHSATVRWYVRSPHDKKAYYTNLRRRWLGFFEEELDMIKQMAANQYGLIIYEKIRTE